MNTRRSLAVVSAFLALASLAACSDPIAAHQTPILLPPQIEMTSSSLANDTACPPPVVARTGAGQLLVSVTVQNRTNSPLVLEYQYEFLSRGIPKQDYGAWMPLSIPPRADGSVPIKSMEAEVDDFRIRFRRATVE